MAKLVFQALEVRSHKLFSWGQTEVGILVLQKVEIPVVIGASRSRTAVGKLLMAPYEEEAASLGINQPESSARRAFQIGRSAINAPQRSLWNRVR